MIVKIHFQSEQDLQWLSRIVERLKNTAVQFELLGVRQNRQSGLRERRLEFLKAARSGGLITTKIEIHNREERKE